MRHYMCLLCYFVLDIFLTTFLSEIMDKNEYNYTDYDFLVWFSYQSKPIINFWFTLGIFQTLKKKKIIWLRLSCDFIWLGLFVPTLILVWYCPYRSPNIYFWALKMLLALYLQVFIVLSPQPLFKWSIGPTKPQVS